MSQINNLAINNVEITSERSLDHSPVRAETYSAPLETTEFVQFPSTKVLENLQQTLDNLINKLTDHTTYKDIHEIHTQINLLKINTIKNEMNIIIEKGSWILEYDDLPPCLNYLLSVFTLTIPIIKPYIDQIKKIILYIDKFSIHPYILQPLFANIIYSIYISEISSNPNLLNNDIIRTITEIQTNIELTMSVFENIFNDIDNKFKNAEDFIGYNNMSILDEHIQMNILQKIIHSKSEQNNLENKLKKIHSLIIQIEHMTHNDIINNIDEFNDKYNRSLNTDNLTDSLKNKLSSDYELLCSFKTDYEQYVLTNYNNLIKYNAFNNINNIDINKFMEKDIIYYWLDHIAFLNGKIFDKMFKHE